MSDKLTPVYKIVCHPGEKVVIVDENIEARVKSIILKKNKTVEYEVIYYIDGARVTDVLTEDEIEFSSSDSKEPLFVFMEEKMRKQEKLDKEEKKKQKKESKKVKDEHEDPVI